MTPAPKQRLDFVQEFWIRSSHERAALRSISCPGRPGPDDARPLPRGVVRLRRPTSDRTGRDGQGSQASRCHAGPCRAQDHLPWLSQGARRGSPMRDRQRPEAGEIWWWDCVDDGAGRAGPAAFIPSTASELSTPGWFVLHSQSAPLALASENPDLRDGLRRRPFLGECCSGAQGGRRRLQTCIRRLGGGKSTARDLSTLERASARRLETCTCRHGFGSARLAEVCISLPRPLGCAWQTDERRNCRSGQDVLVHFLWRLRHGEIRLRGRELGAGSNQSPQELPTDWFDDAQPDFTQNRLTCCGVTFGSVRVFEGAPSTAPQIPPTSKKSGRLDYQEHDAPLVEEMVRMIGAGEARGPMDAADQLALRAAGSQNHASKRARLLRRFKAHTTNSGYT